MDIKKKKKKQNQNTTTAWQGMVSIKENSDEEVRCSCF